MDTAKNIILSNNFIPKKDLIDKIRNKRKCTVCGKYGDKKEIYECKKINHRIFAHICTECYENLLNGNAINYDSDFIEDIIDDIYKHKENNKNSKEEEIIY